MFRSKNNSRSSSKNRDDDRAESPVDISTDNIYNDIEDNQKRLLEYLKENREMIRNIIRNKHFKNCSEIQNILDNILLSISKTIYLCKLE